MSKLEEQAWKDSSDPAKLATEQAADNSFMAEAAAEVNATQQQVTTESTEFQVSKLETQLASIEKRAELAEQQAAERQDQYVRILSEMENIKRRSEQEVVKARKFGTEQLIRDILPILDSLDQAVLSTSEASPMKEGVVLTIKLFDDLLMKFSVKPLDPLGDVFDPKVHEAMSMQAASEAHQANTIVKVFQKGYLLHGRVIRPARVIVAQ